MKSEYNSNEEWVARVVGNRAGTRFFIKIINFFGIFPAYAVLPFAACQYLLLDKISKRALIEYRHHLGYTTSKYDLFKHFISFGVTLIDRYAFVSNRCKKCKTLHINEELINQELSLGNGVILLGAHFGNWELAGSLLTKRITARVHVFMYGVNDSDIGEDTSVIDNLIIHHVQNTASDIAVEIINALRNGDIVCLHGDRFLENQKTEMVDFLGEKARFPIGPMAMAAITGASVLTCFTVRTGLLKYTFSAEEPIRITENGDRGERARQIIAATQQYAAFLEAKCRAYPLQWYNFYRFWKN